MKPDKVPHQFILVLIAFGVSFLLGLIFYKNNLQAFYTMLISLPTVSIATWGTNAYRRYQNIIIYDELEQDLDDLEAEEEEIDQYLSSANLMRQEMETRLQNLVKEKAYLLEYISKLNLERRKLAEDIHSLQIKEKYHRDIYSSKHQEIAQLESKNDELSFKLELLEITIEKKQQQLNEIDHSLQDFDQSQQGLLQQKNQLIQQVQEIQVYYQQLTENVEKIQRERQELDRQFMKEKREIANFKTVITEQSQQQEKYNQILQSLETKRNELELNIKQLNLENQRLTKVVEEQQNKVKNFTKPYIRFNFFPQEWQEWINFCEQLNAEEKQVFKAILEENNQVIKTIADQQSTPPQVLIENLNQKALQVMGDQPFIPSENSFIPRIQDQYLSIFQELLVIKFLDTLP